MAAIFTAQQFIDNGFHVSLQMSQAEIDRAVMDAFMCYVGKVSTISVTPDGHIVHTPEQGIAAMQLAFILLCQRNTFATRAGGKMKLSPQLSENAQARQTDYDNADRLLRQLQAATGGIAGEIDKMVDDICMIYMRNYLSM